MQISTTITKIKNLIKHDDVEIDKKYPFNNCKLDREKYATVLTSLIENYGDGFVLALNNKWGAGKTTFVKMWEQMLTNKGYETIYFNAWENDFEDNPLTALIGELNIIKKEESITFNKVVSSAAKLSKNILPAIAKGVLNKYVDSELIIDVVHESIKTATEIFEADVNDYVKRKESIKEFRKSLGDFVANNFNGKPLIFFIDELDRCRPNYSVSLLEQVKHFFNVPNIIFVLSIDKIQLGHAICGVYGSEKIDANQYLKRFIDVEFEIPQPDKNKFFEYLYDYYDFDSFLNSNERIKIREFQYDRDGFMKSLKNYIGILNLREQEKIMSHIRISLKTLSTNKYLIPDFLCFIIYCKFIQNDFYLGLSNKTLKMADAHTKMFEILTDLNFDNRDCIKIEAYFLNYYNSYLNNGYGEKVYVFNREISNYELNIKSKFNSEELMKFYEYYNDYGYRGELDLNLDYFINVIDLTYNPIVNI
ncbi:MULTISPECIES: KAP family P-loop NTPase fold protein [Empedobacter]|uniref:KAP family P-loop NTPase fold protein n=1 Tax=Empedobacter TaxID=59734 RepID=UPI001FD58A2D|nr:MULTISPECIES: P-loop NTPase fold protein [Empedobacter]MDH2208323.1 KAP family NTPase [Empedobacter sp. GD03644]